jgi:polyisoprenoid-binding protein YceI
MIDLMRGARIVVRNICLAAAIAGLISAPALALPSAPKGTYALDPQHTQILFEIKHMGISTFFGRLTNVSGNINFDQSAPEQSTLTVQVDMHTIDTHVPELDRTLKSIFQADTYPFASFSATRVTRTSENTGVVAGNLTIANVSRPVNLNVTFNGGSGSGEPMQPYRVGYDATATLKRSDFGLTRMIWSGFVSDDVQLVIEAEAVRR